MRELDIQTKAKDAILEMGGFAMKMSNRFLVGVPDLLFQLPGHSTSMWEVKWTPRPALTANLTQQQKRWLLKFADCGGFGGVLYFVHDMNDMRVAMKPVEYFPQDYKAPWKFKYDDFVKIPRGSKMQPFKDLVQKIHEERRECQL